MSPRFRIESFDSSRHERASFDCGEPALTTYLRQYARQHRNSGVAVPYVVVEEPDLAQILGYYTLTATRLDMSQIPPDQRKHWPSQATLGAALLGRLAVDHRHQGRGLGKRLLFDAFLTTAELSERIGLIGLVVDVKPNALKFYEHFQFTPLDNAHQRLWIALPVIRELLKEVDRLSDTGAPSA